MTAFENRMATKYCKTRRHAQRGIGMLRRARNHSSYNFTGQVFKWK
jgi:hypothetical protein